MNKITLKHPFQNVTDYEAQFGFGPKVNFKKLYEECPAEFKQGHWNYRTILFNKWFFGGLTKDEYKNLQFKESDEVLQSQQVKFLRSIMTSWSCKHEEKEAVCSWLISLIIKQ